ncbi:MAG: hypothetical protein ACU0E9_07845 [Limimaricola soesokkakensis]|uniref:hypothetical protein n=1 Tax=Limimaricola soesokkakensis TaxID=1343159 RepID=UPI0040599194
MSAHHLAQIEELQTRLSRAQAIALEIQRVALDAQTDNAEESLNLIDALSDALGHRIEAMINDAASMGQRFGAILEGCTALSTVLDDSSGK